MPLQIELIRAAEFVRVGPNGKFDLAASKEALATLAAGCHRRGIDNALMDLRALQPGPKPVFTTSDLLELVNTFPEVGFTKRLRLAILYGSDPHKRARLFAFVSTLHGWKVSAFGDFEHALLWLSSAAESPTPRKLPLERRVRITTPSYDRPCPNYKSSPVKGRKRRLSTPRASPTER